MEEYRTVKRGSESFFVEKKSKFIYSALPTDEEDKAIHFIEYMRKKYSNARHHVYAYKLRDRGIMRYSDDGEPQGTGGMPMMNVINNIDLVDLCIVVTRYFGGILLGTGGLTRAYSNGAKLAIENSGIALMRKCLLLNVDIDYSIYGKVSGSICELSGEIVDTIFTDTVRIIFYIQISELENMREKILEISSGKSNIFVMKEEYRSVKE